MINEIMYRPGTSYPENPALEFIEIYNPDATAVDVSGWAITKGVSYTFPAGSSISANGYLIIAADLATFQSTYPSVSNIKGPWLAGSSLSDKGETITLSKPGATAGSFTTVDSISYADEGDWANRNFDTTQGWNWVTGANGGGKSLERRNPTLISNSGQNWGDSSAVGGSPGAVNSNLTANIAPVIQEVKHSPAVPKSTEAVTISCRLTDELSGTSLTATLFWRSATAASPPAFSTLLMTGNGSGYFSASLPAMADKTIIEFYVSATDGTLTRTWPATTTNGQTANCHYQVDNEIITGIHPAYRLIFNASEHSAYTSVVASSNRQFNLTFIASKGDDHTIRYRTTVRNRGNTSRSWPVRPARISFPTDSTWDGVSDFAINSKYPYCQYLGMRSLQLAGLTAGDATPIEVRRNGVEYRDNTSDFGKLVRVEELNGDYVSNHWPEAPSGNIYRAEGMNGTQWASTGTTPTNPETLWNGWSKQNGSGLNDWSDIANFSTVWQNVAASHFTGATPGNVASGNWNNVPFSDEEVATLSTVCDMDQIARFFAVFAILQNSEVNITTGNTDDYAAAWVENSLGQKRLNLIPYDQDNNLGKGDTPKAFNYSGIYDMTSAPDGIFEPLLPLFGNTITPGNSAFREKYLTEIRKLYGGLFDAEVTPENPNPAFHRFLDNHVGTWVDAATLASLKTFATQRQQHILGQVGAPKILPAPNSSGTFTAASTPSIRINEVMASNISAYENGMATYPDIIELHNSSSASVNLGDMSLTDDPLIPRKYIFPAGTTIPANGYLLVYADSNTTQPGLHTLFQLNSNGDSVHFYQSIANGGGLIDEITFGPQAANLTISRTAANPSIWTLTNPTIEMANANALALGSIGDLGINEWAGNTQYRLDQDFIEFYNRSGAPLAFGNTRLTDDAANYPSLRVFPPLSFIAPNGFILFNESDLGYKLDGNFGYITLIGENGDLIDQVSIDSQFGDRSTGRSTDGAGTYTQFTIPSPGFSNNMIAPAAYNNLLSSLRITEIMAKPNGGSNYEFIELQNIGITSLDLSGVRFTNGIDYTFPAGTTLAVGQFIVICRDRATFLTRYPSATASLAPGAFTGALDNSGETLALTLPLPWDVHVLNFFFDPDWFPSTANSGYSLTTINASTSLAQDWDKSYTWSPSTDSFGSPGSEGPPIITSAASASAVLNEIFNYQITANRFPSSYGASNLPSGLNINTSTGLISGTPSTVGTFNTTIIATNAGGTANQAITFTVNTSGPLTNFTWDYLPASSPAGSPFAVQITARDSAGRVVTSFNGNTSLTGSVTTGTTGSPIVITEITDVAEDQFELQNVTNASVNTRGWYVKVSDGNANINMVGVGQLNLPNTMAAGGLLWGSENNVAPRTWWGSPINWSSTGSPSRGWIMLFDGTNTLRDFLIWGWTATDFANLNVTINSINITGSSISNSGNWSGAPVTTPGVNISSIIKRNGSSDTNISANFTNTTTGNNFNATNQNLTIPWITITPVTVTPASAIFSNGIYTAYEKISTPLNNIILKATDSLSGNIGNSTPINITSPLLDADNDGMPNIYETANGLDNNSNDAALDTDGDGLSNLYEFIFGTAANNSSSLVQLTSPTVSTTHLSATWNATAGKIYQIESSTDLSGTWTPHTPLQLTTTTGPRTIQIPKENNDKLFLRIKVTQP